MEADIWLVCKKIAINTATDEKTMLNQKMYNFFMDFSTFLMTSENV